MFDSGRLLLTENGWIFIYLLDVAKGWATPCRWASEEFWGFYQSTNDSILWKP